MHVLHHMGHVLHHMMHHPSKQPSRSSRRLGRRVRSQAFTLASTRVLHVHYMYQCTLISDRSSTHDIGLPYLFCLSSFPSEVLSQQLPHLQRLADPGMALLRCPRSQTPAQCCPLRLAQRRRRRAAALLSQRQLTRAGWKLPRKLSSSWRSNTARPAIR